SSRRRHTRSYGDWSSDVCSSDLLLPQLGQLRSVSEEGGRPCLASYASSRWSARNRLWQDWHSVSGSTNSAMWPDATQTSRARIRSEERRVGKECRSRRARDASTK